jgi:hypothetical protein
LVETGTSASDAAVYVDKVRERAVLTFIFANEVIRFKLLFYYLTKFNLPTKEKEFIKSYDSYFLFTYDYDEMLKDCSFFSIDEPKTIKDGIEIMIYLKENDDD